MALSRKSLAAMGIEADKIDEIITMHTETVNALKDERDSFKEQAEKLPGVQKELDELKAENGKESPYKEQYEQTKKELDELKTEYETYKDGQAKKETAAKKKAAYRDMLKEAGVSEKRIDTVLKVSDYESIELSDDGKITDAEKLIEDVKKEWSDFIVTRRTEGANPANPPGGTDGKGAPTGRAAEIAKQYHESLYGKATE